VNSTQASTGATSGAIRTPGGVYVGNDSVFDGDLTVNGSLNAPNLSFSSIVLTNTQASTGAGSGSFQTPGGVYVAKDSVFDGDLTVNGSLNATNLSFSSIVLTNTQASTGAGSGSFQTPGGVYVAKDSVFDGDLTVNGSLNATNLSFSSLVLTNTQASTGAGSGALQVSGGAYFGKSVYFSSALRYAVNITSVSGFAVGIDDYMIETTCLTTCTITLPSVSGNVGRELIIFNNSPNNSYVAIYPVNGERLNGVVNNDLVLPETYSRTVLRCNTPGWNEY